MKKYVSLFLIWVAFILPSQGCSTISSSDTVKVELIQEEETVQPGRSFWVALRLQIEDGWHVYWKNPGDAGMPLKVDWQLPEGYEAGPLQWPFPEKFTTADMIGFGYKDSVMLLSQITPPQNSEIKTNQPLNAKVEWLVCSSLMCQPGSASVSMSVNIQEEEPKFRDEVTAFFVEARSKLPTTQIKIATKRKDGIVQLEVPPLKNVVGAYFFPEEQDVIDHSVDPTFALNSNDSNSYLVSLKEKDEVGVPRQTLKGVLVLHTRQGDSNQVEAVDVNSQIQDDSGLLSMADTTAMKVAINGQASVVSESAFNFEGGIGLALLFAFLGGMILNLMPCVLPVISLKIMSFVKLSGEKRSLTLKHGLWFSFGVLFSFWILAGAILIFRSYGQAVGWGFQLQEPIFVVALASLMFIFALSLFGVFEWGLIFASWAGQTQADKAQKSSGFTGSFFSGVLATAVATPCTGPFLGSAVGFALTLPAYQALFIFTSLGLGMCFPYLLLAAFPALLRFIPKPGAWMETFKQLMGFVLLASVLWLMWVFSAQTNSFSVICFVAGLLCFAFGGWIYGRGGVPSVGKTKRILAYVSVVLCFFVGVQAILLPKQSWSQEAAAKGDNHWKGWETFSPERVAELRAQGTPVFIDFTAKWCLICQANHFVLASQEIDRKFAQEGVVKMVADWTKNDPIITEELSKFGRNSVPLYVYYGPDKAQDPVILPQLLTPDVVISEIDALPKIEIASEAHFSK
jgi:thiol:disulfide interchange protein DsbD